MTRETSLLLSRWTGGLGRPLTGNCVRVPAQLEMRDRRLIYSGTSKTKQVEVSGLLDHFIALADRFSLDHDILKFARRFGPLYLCERHGLASYHKPVLMNFSPLGPAPIIGIDEPFTYDWCGPKMERRTPETFSEPFETWRALARRAESLLLVANAVRLRGNAPPELWEKADGFKERFGERYGSRWAYLDNPWHRLAANLDYWIIASDVCLRIGVEGPSLVASLGSNLFTFSSFALVAIQLLLAITRSEGLASCSGCGAPFISGRQPLAGKAVGRWIAKRNYCQTCRRAKVPQRDAARDYRNRKAQKSTLH
jgi:hypothetical protein